MSMHAPSLSIPSPLLRMHRRHHALRILRNWFWQQDFWEVDTPQLVPAPGLEPHIDPLSVRVALDAEQQHKPETERALRWLHTSPEFALKRAVAAGAEKIYQISHVFRDGERTKRHLPEFTMLEWYRVGASLQDLIVDVYTMLQLLRDEMPAHKRAWIDTYTGPEVLTVREAWIKYADIDLQPHLYLLCTESVGIQAGGQQAGTSLVEAVKAKGHVLRPQADWEDAFFHIMTSVIEPQIGQTRPTVLCDWPRQMAVLAKLNRHPDAMVHGISLYAERFEMYWQGLELCNAFAELTDPVEQRARFMDDNQIRQKLGKPAYPLDEDFLQDLGNMPDTSGIALGFDRLLMAVYQDAHQHNIDDVQGIGWR